MSRYAALLDACVLVPVALADTLLRLAEQDLYRPLWSDRILSETTTAIERVHPEFADGQGKEANGMLFRGPLGVNGDSAGVRGGEVLLLKFSSTG